MLALYVVQILAAFSLIAMAAGLVVGHLTSAPRGIVRVVARADRGRWREAVWIGSVLVAVLWPVGVLVLPAYAYRWPALPDFPYSTVWQLLGFSVAMLGGALFFAARRALGRHMTPAIQLQEDHRLVQEGPYRFVRHPVYTAIVLVAGGLSLLYLSPVLVVIALALLGMALYRAHLEEELLASPEGFGKAYLEYIARTGRFLPRLRTRP